MLQINTIGLFSVTTSFFHPTRAVLSRRYRSMPATEKPDRAVSSLCIQSSKISFSNLSYELTLALVSLLFIGTANARATQLSGEMLLFQDIPKVMTASRQTVSVLESPATSTIITREDILHSGFNSVSDLVMFVTGMDFFKASGAGPDVGIRGVNGVQSNQVLVLLDGRPIFNPARNSNQCALIPSFPNDIERIEVIRGPGSALYGSNAFAGVVNIITRTPEEIDGVDLMASPGTFDSHLYNFNMGKKSGKLSYKLLGGWTQEASMDDHHNHIKGLLKFSGELDYAWQPGSKAELSFGITSGSISVLPMSFFSTFDQGGEDAFVRTKLNLDDTHFDIWWRHHSTSGDIKSSDESNEHYWKFDNINITGYHQFRWKGHETIAGAELKASSLGATSYDRWHNQFLYSFFMEDRWRLPSNFNLFLSGRYDHHTCAGGAFSPRLSLVKQLGATQSLRFSASQAFKYPSYLQNYIEQDETFPNFTFHHVGNRDLDPEKLVSLELAYQTWNISGFNALLAIFYNNYSDIIDFDVDAVPGRVDLSYGNMYDMYQYGGELDISYRLNRNLLLRFNYSYVWKQKKDTVTFGPVPTNQINGEIRYDHDTGLWCDLRIHWQDDSDYSTGLRMPTNIFPTSTAPTSPSEILKKLTGWHIMSGYTYGDLSFGYMPKNAPYSITCAIHNLFHDTTPGFPGGPESDTTFTGRIAWHF